MSMYKRSNFLDNDNFNQLELMYYHLHDGYKHVKEELKASLKENKKLKIILNDYDKNIHSFID